MNSLKILEQVDEWIGEYCDDLTASSWLDSEDEEEWWDKKICVAGGGEHLQFLEVQGDYDVMRWNYPIRGVIVPIKELYIIRFGNCLYCSEEEPPKFILDNCSYCHSYL